MGSPVSFVLSRMAACGGAAKNKLSVSKRVWDFLSRERAARLARLTEETQVSVLVDGETPDIYVLQLCAPPPAPPGRLCAARKALKALLKETEKELKKAQRGPGGRGGGAAGTAAASAASGGSRGEEEPERQCPICLGEIQKMKTLEKCRHSFCEACITRALQVKTACPMCGRFYGRLVGNQPPNGRMLVSRDASLLLPGYEKFGTIIIQYVFPPGVQGAFEQRLTFTVGTSMTTGRANVITWNDIHHKTNCTGGPQLFGYPDPTYLARVQEELRAKGITED